MSDILKSACSPCDLCQRVECIGVDECQRFYGDNYTFVVDKGVKRYSTNELSDDDRRENDEYLAYVTSLP